MLVSLVSYPWADAVSLKVSWWLVSTLLEREYV